MADNLDEISEIIFNDSVKPTKSIFLEIEQEDEKMIFSIMSLLAVNGMKILFNKSNPVDLSDSEFSKLNLYFNSFGYKIIFSANSEENPEHSVTTPQMMLSLINAGYHFAKFNISFKALQ